jgi:hypothetical protein
LRCQFVRSSAELERAEPAGLRAAERQHTKMKIIVKFFSTHCDCMSKSPDQRIHNYPVLLTQSKVRLRITFLLKES